MYTDAPRTVHVVFAGKSMQLEHCPRKNVWIRNGSHVVVVAHLCKTNENRAFITFILKEIKQLTDTIFKHENH